MCLLCSCVWWLVSFMWSITYVWGLWPSTGACLNLSSANMSLRRGWNRYVLSAGLLVASILVNGNYYLLQNVWCVFTRAVLMMYWQNSLFNWLLFETHLWFDLTGKLTHLPLDKMAAISQPLFSNTFTSWMKSRILIKKNIHWSFFPMVPLTKYQHWFR